jgi:Leucine-rich repeat (LRR) protein
LESSDGQHSEHLGNLSALETLHLSYNKLSGNIPPSLGSLTNLTMLTMTGNQLSGAIPPSWEPEKSLRLIPEQ